MRNIFKIACLLLILFSCQVEKEIVPVESTDWDGRKSEIFYFNDFAQGKSYLPVYSAIYQIYERRTFELTSTVSIRNISETDSVYILRADYYNTIGENIRQYIESPIYLKPLETVEIVIEKQDTEGGTGANFVFHWAMINDNNPPLFEAVMISADGAQGLAFTTRGVQILD